MLGWFKTLLERRRLRGRGLFRFYDPSERRYRYADPIAVHQAIHEHPKLDEERHFAALERGEEPETSEVLAIVREAFGASKFNASSGTGWTVSETLQVWDSFMAYIDSQKKSIESRPNWQSPTESEFSVDQSDDTTCSADSISCEAAANCESPTESCQEVRPLSN